ncbi:MAG: membrane protein-like protein [uncultured bacterium]|nr:MAG: membrane protein-like protein [uncultured bacterium]
MAPFGRMIAGLDLRVDNAQLAIGRSRQKLVEMKGIGLSGSVEMAGGRTIVNLGRLALAEPSLELTGALTLAPTSPAITLNLSGAAIDVDAIRGTALALAGDTTPIKILFDYLRGGRVPQLSFTSHGENAAELGNLNNILIKGQLQDGKISIPGIDLDLTEVALGDVVISKGVLQATGLSARLAESAGREGALKGVPVPIIIAGGQLTLGNKQLDLDQLGGSLGQSRFADLSCRFLWEKEPTLAIRSGRFDLDMAELYPWLASLEGLRDTLRGVKRMTGRLELSTLDLEGRIDRPSEWEFASTGTVQDLSIDTPLFPNTIALASGGFKADTQRLTFAELKTSSRDAALTLSGSLNGFPKRLGRIELSLDGTMGPQSVKWLSDRLKVPKSYAIRAPLSIGNAQVAWQPDSTASFKGLVSIEKGPGITADIDYRPGQLQVNRLHIKDRYSDADVVLAFSRDRHDFRFAGTLQNETLQTVFVDPRFNSGRLEGDLTVAVPQSGQAEVAATGQLIGEKLPIFLPSGDTIHIERIALIADGPQVNVDIAELTWKNLTWKPVAGTVSFDRDRADFRLAGAKLCGISSLGLFSFAGDEFFLDLTLKGEKLDVATSYTCLTEGRVRATGRLDFASKITARGKMDDLVKNMKGPVQLTLSNGVIEQDKLVARTLEVLNFTEIVRGRLPDLDSTGFAYRTMTLQGKFQNGKLLIHKYFMDGETLDLIGYGEIDLEKKTLDGQLLAAPFKTVDTIVKYIPGVNYLLGGSLVAIPIGITGVLGDPRVEVMSASAVGSSLYNLAERTIKSPLKLFDTFNPWGKRNGK